MSKLSEKRIWGFIGVLAAIFFVASIAITALTPPGQRLANHINQQFLQLAVKIKNHIRKRKYHPEIRRTASKLVSGKDPTDFVARVSSIFRFVADSIGYVLDPVDSEHISDPVDTLYVGAGDCDCKSILLTTLLESVGYKSFVVLVKPAVDLTSARILENGHAFVVVSVPDPTKFGDRTRSEMLMALCKEGGSTRYVLPLESTVCGAHAGWLPEDAIRAIREHRYIVVDPDSPSVADRNLSLIMLRR